ncbi:MAG: glycosyltransferase family 4 protein [Dehalococcoidia bacterium]|nr:glycosyltransferase family 4 protein [Dehalococcoidia bacterium]
MRICILSYRSYPYSGGQGIYMRYLSNALRDLDHEVDMMSGPPYPIVDDGVGLIRLPSLDLYRFGSWQRLFIDPRKLNTSANFMEWGGIMTGYFSEPLAFGMRAYRYLCRDSIKKYDVIHDNQTMSWGIADIQKAGYPVVETIHHPVTIDRDLAIQSAKSLKDKLGFRRWFSFTGMQIKVARQLPFIITVSEMAKQHINEIFGIPESRMKVIYNGIDVELFSPSGEVPRLDNQILMVMSRDTAVKGLRFLLEALAELRKKWDLKLVVVGRTLGDGVTEKLMDRLGVTDAVTFRNQIETSELIQLYRSSTLVAVPSTYEGFGLPAAEAMACGAPLVSTTAGALPEVVGDAGILIPPADSEALTAAIAQLMESPAKRGEYSVLARKRILEKFNWSNAARLTAEVYLEAIEAKRAK